MKLYISQNFYAEADTTLLGYMGETNARTIDVSYPEVEGADTYRLRFKYKDGIVYDVPIVDGVLTVTGSLLREVGKVACQWLATKSNGETYDLVAKSQIFVLDVGQSIGDDVAPVPTYEQALDMLDKLNEGIDSKITAPEEEGTDGQALVTDGQGNRFWRTIQGSGSGGSYDDTEVRELIATNTQAIEALDENKADKSNVPTKTSDLTNDSNFVSDEHYQHTDNNFTTAEKQKLAGLSNYDDTAIRPLIAGKADTSAIPTKTSDLQNDSGYITQHQDISGKQDKSSLETDVKAFINASYIQSLLPIYNGGVE